jgi:hypothetical protein
LKGQKKIGKSKSLDKELNEKFEGNTDKLIRKYAPPLLSASQVH